MSLYNSPKLTLTKGFGLFLKSMCKYNDRYDVLLHKKVRLKPFRYSVNPVNPLFNFNYKIYDKYSTTGEPIKTGLDNNEAHLLVRVMNEDDILYLRQIYQYCTGDDSSCDWLFTVTYRC